MFSTTSERKTNVPQLDVNLIDETPFDVFGLRFEPIPLMHGNDTIFGFRFGDVAYLTDHSEIPAVVDANVCAGSTCCFSTRCATGLIRPIRPLSTPSKRRATAAEADLFHAHVPRRGRTPRPRRRCRPAFFSLTTGSKSKCPAA